MLLGFPFWIDAFLFLFLVIFMDKAQFMFVTFVIYFFILIINLTNIGVGKESPFYREHEKYTKGNRYEKNVKDEISMPYGDLYVLDAGLNPDKQELIREPRTVEFITDELGFRNSPNTLKKADIILVGDSFIVGNGTTQNKAPANTLQSITGKTTASLAHPGDPDSYEKLMIGTLSLVTADAKFYVFYFEGNDFKSKSLELEQTKKIKKLVGKFNYIYFQFEQGKDILMKKVHRDNNLFFRSVRAHSHLLNNKLFDISEFGSVTYRVIGNKVVAFMRSYDEMSMRNDLNTYIFQNENTRNRVNGVFFIPTKYRTYSKIIQATLPESGYKYLANSYKSFNIPVYDLTSCLQDAAINSISSEEYVYWRDDTHWNHLGIFAAMKCVAQNLSL